MSAALFVGKDLGEGSTQYTSRRTGRIYTVKPDLSEYGNFGLYAEADGLLILGSDRKQLVSFIELADNQL